MSYIDDSEEDELGAMIYKSSRTYAETLREGSAESNITAKATADAKTLDQAGKEDKESNAEANEAALIHELSSKRIAKGSAKISISRSDNNEGSASNKLDAAKSSLRQMKSNGGMMLSNNPQASIPVAQASTRVTRPSSHIIEQANMITVTLSTDFLKNTFDATADCSKKRRADGHNDGPVAKKSKTASQDRRAIRHDGNSAYSKTTGLQEEEDAIGGFGSMINWLNNNSNGSRRGNANSLTANTVEEGGCTGLEFCNPLAKQNNASSEAVCRGTTAKQNKSKHILPKQTIGTSYESKLSEYNALAKQNNNTSGTTKGVGVTLKPMEDSILTMQQKNGKSSCGTQKKTKEESDAALEAKMKNREIANSNQICYFSRLRRNLELATGKEPLASHVDENMVCMKSMPNHFMSQHELAARERSKCVQREQLIKKLEMRIAVAAQAATMSLHNNAYDSSKCPNRSENDSLYYSIEEQTMKDHSANKTSSLANSDNDSIQLGHQNQKQIIEYPVAKEKKDQRLSNMIEHKDAAKHHFHLKRLRGNMRLLASKESGNDFLEYCAKEQGVGTKKAGAPLAAKNHEFWNHSMQQRKQLVGNKRDREYRRRENETAIGSVKKPKTVSRDKPNENDIDVQLIMLQNQQQRIAGPLNYDGSGPARKCSLSPEAMYKMHQLYQESTLRELQERDEELIQTKQLRMTSDDSTSIPQRNQESHDSNDNKSNTNTNTKLDKIGSSCAQKKSQNTASIPQTRHRHQEKIGNSCTQMKVQKPEWSWSRLKYTLTKLSKIALQPPLKGNIELLLARQGWNNLEERMNIGCSSSCPPPFMTQTSTGEPVATEQMRSSNSNDTKGVIHKKSGIGCSWSVLKRKMLTTTKVSPHMAYRSVLAIKDRNSAYHFRSHEAMHSASQPSKETTSARREGSVCTSMSNDGNKLLNTNKSSHSLSEIFASRTSRYVESNCAQIVDTNSLMDLYMWHRDYQANVFQGIKDKHRELPLPLIPESPSEACALRDILLKSKDYWNKVYSTNLTTAADRHGQRPNHGVMLDTTARQRPQTRPRASIVASKVNEKEDEMTPEEAESEESKDVANNDDDVTPNDVSTILAKDAPTADNSKEQG